MRAPYGGTLRAFQDLQQQETDDCVLWPYSNNGAGYGEIRIDRKKHYVHRLSCEIAHGPPPFPRAEAAHSCNNPPCLNSRHLRWTDRSGNMNDRVDAGTSNRGERCGAAKLTRYDVADIRESYPFQNAVSLALQYKVSPATIHDIIHRRTWKWL